MFFAWLEGKRLSPADITPHLADDFIRDLCAKGKDADSCRLYVAGVSSFYTFLERHFDEIKKSFLGTKTRPKATWKTAVIPSPEEIETIIESAEPLLKAALVIIAETVMRIGGLHSFTTKPDGTMVTLN
jgi:integrase